MSFHASGSASAVGDLRTTLREITTEQLRDLGVHRMPYVRAGMYHGERTSVLFNAVGRSIGRAATKDAVCEVVDESGLAVVAIH